ncbi:hypothetical protein ABTE96_22075, partial [Acinetobacter baumannii]
KSHRHDLSIEADIIEEIARIYGYDHIAPKNMTGEFVVKKEKTSVDPSIYIASSKESCVSTQHMKHLLKHRGYHEAVSYSFID